MTFNQARHIARTIGQELARGSSVALLACGATTVALASGIDPASATAARATTKASTSTTLVAKANGSGVTVNADVPAKIAAGQMVTVRFSFNGVGPEGASAEVREPGAGGRVLLAVQLPPGKAHTADVTVQAQADGLQFLNVTTSQNGRTSVQQVALPVGSGQALLKPSGTSVVTPSGERLVTLPSSK